MAIQGLRDSANYTANSRPENWREGILMLYPRSAEAAKAPLTALTSKMKTASTNDPIFHWWEKSLQTRRVTFSTNLAAVAAGTIQTITVSSGAFGLKAGDMLLVENSVAAGLAGERLQVTQDPTADTALTVMRGAAGTTPVATNPATSGVNPNLLCIGSAFEEGSLAPTQIAFDPTELSNYTQIFRSTYGITRTGAKTKTRTGDEVKELKRENLENIGIDMERAFFWGVKGASTKNGRPIRYTNGIYNYIPAAQRIATTGAALKMSQLEDWMLQIFAYGSSQKVGFCGNRALLAIQQAVRKNSNYQIFVNEKEYGMKITRILSPFGELVLLSHPLMTQTAGGTNTTAYYGQDAAMFVLDMANIRYRYLDGSDLSFEDELEVPGMDGMQAGYIGECGLEINHASTHFYFYNMNAGAAD